MDEPQRPSFSFVMTCATLQGVALHLLSRAATDSLWPYTSPVAWYPLLLVSVYLAPVAYGLGEWSRRRLSWASIAAIAVLLVGFGLFHGSRIASRPLASEPSSFEQHFLLFLAVFAFLFHALPFVQARLSSGRWVPQYRAVFAYAWQNAMALALSALFSLVTWTLLWVWAQLFEMLDLNFFQVIFFRTGPDAAYLMPVIAGASFVLAGTAYKTRAVLHTQLLALLKWFALLAVMILVLFSVALIFEARALFTVHRHAISATWLLAIALITVYLYNSAYGDGSDNSPYPAVLGRLLRFVTPLLVVVSALALFGLSVRVDEYGLTVMRVLGIFVAIVTIGYASAYTWVAMRPGAWMAGMGSINMVAALGFVVVVMAMLSPILSPYRLSAASMEQRILAAPLKKGKLDPDPFLALRFDTGQYGHEGLQRLEALGEHPHRELIQLAARNAVAATNRWSSRELTLPKPTLMVHPEGVPLDAALRDKLLFDSSTWCRSAESCVAHVLFVDLAGSGRLDAVFLSGGSPVLFRRVDGRWVRVGDGETRGSYGCLDSATVSALMSSGSFHVAEPTQRNLTLGAHTFSFPALEDDSGRPQQRTGCAEDLSVSSAADEE